MQFHTPSPSASAWLQAKPLGDNYIYVTANRQWRMFFDVEVIKDNGETKKEKRPCRMQEYYWHIMHKKTREVFTIKRYWSRGREQWADSREAKVASKFTPDRNIRMAVSVIAALGKMDHLQAENLLNTV